MKQVWVQNGNTFRLSEVTSQTKKIKGGIYTVCYDEMRDLYYLSHMSDSFHLPSRLYGTKPGVEARIIKTWESGLKDFGVLLNGIRGTGKTITAKSVSNQLIAKYDIPVLLITGLTPNLPAFLNEIPQDYIILIDEYEKIFQESGQLLSLLDGVLNTGVNKLTLLTTNNRYINENMLDRPTRLRYTVEYGNLESAVVKEILEDLLQDSRFLDSTLAFISKLDIVTVDIVKQIAMEVNIHKEDPAMFKEVFNVTELEQYYGIEILSDFKDKKGVRISSILSLPDVIEVGGKLVVTPGRPLEDEGRNIYGLVLEEQNGILKIKTEVIPSKLQVLEYLVKVTGDYVPSIYDVMSGYIPAQFRRVENIPLSAGKASESEMSMNSRIEAKMSESSGYSTLEPKEPTLSRISNMVIGEEKPQEPVFQEVYIRIVRKTFNTNKSFHYGYGF